MAERLGRVELVRVPARVLARYRDLAFAVDGFVSAPDVQAAFRRACIDTKTGAPMWTMFGFLVATLEALRRSCDEADAELARAGIRVTSDGD